jgi:hypothetical protein
MRIDQDLKIIVFPSLGQHPSDYERTVENIKQIVVALRAMDKPVFVASLPCKANVSRMQKELIDRRNKLLKEWLKSYVYSTAIWNYINFLELD